MAGSTVFFSTPLWSNKAFTFPYWDPAKTISPIFNVPPCTIIVVRYPLPLSSSDSITVPTAFLSGFAFNSSNSASNNTFSSNSSTPSPVLADTS